MYKLWRQGRRGSRLALAGLTIDLNPSPSTTDASTLRTVQPSIASSPEKPCEITLVDPFAPPSLGGQPPDLAVIVSATLDPMTPGVPLPDVQAPVTPSPILSAPRRFSRARFGSVSVTESQATRVNSLHQLHSKLHGIILRVSAYPVALVIVNIAHTGKCIVRGLAGHANLYFSTGHIPRHSWRGQEPDRLAIVLHLYLSVWRSWAGVCLRKYPTEMTGRDSHGKLTSPVDDPGRPVSAQGASHSSSGSRITCSDGTGLCSGMDHPDPQAYFR